MLNTQPLIAPPAELVRAHSDCRGSGVKAQGREGARAWVSHCRRRRSPGGPACSSARCKQLEAGC